MSAPNINISSENILGKCDLKCSYNFKYVESNSTAKNNGVIISLTYDNNSVPPVIYNNQKYNVSNIRIMTPSIHLFNNVQASAEIVIEHVPVTGGKLFAVGIPITSSSDTSNASSLLTDIIQTVAANAPAPNDSTNLNMSNFTLQQIVPSKPFFSYSTQVEDWVVFGILDAIPLSDSVLATLGQIIKPFPIPTPGESLFYNSAGPNTGTGLDDGIYISCSPTGSSGEETGVAFAKNPTSYDLSSISNDPVVQTIFQIIVGCILFIIIFLIINYGYALIPSDSIKIPSISNIT